MNAPENNWTLLFRDTSSPMLHICAYLVGAATAYRHTGKVASPWLIDFTNRTEKTCAPIGPFEEESRHILSRLDEPKFFEAVRTGQQQAIGAALDFARPLRHRDFSGLDDGPLGEIYSELSSRFTDMNRWGHVINSTDADHGMLSSKVFSLVSAAAERQKSATSSAEAFGTLTTPEERSRLRQQDFEFYGLLARIQDEPAAEKLFSGPVCKIAA